MVVTSMARRLVRKTGDSLYRLNLLYVSAHSDAIYKQKIHVR
jgi:hypothetical protein